MEHDRCISQGQLCVFICVLQGQHLGSTADRVETTGRQNNSLDECKEGSEEGQEEIEK